MKDPSAMTCPLAIIGSDLTDNLARRCIGKDRYRTAASAAGDAGSVDALRLSFEGHRYEQLGSFLRQPAVLITYVRPVQHLTELKRRGWVDRSAKNRREIATSL